MSRSLQSQRIATLGTCVLLAACTASGTPASQAPDRVPPSSLPADLRGTCIGVHVQDLSVIEPAHTWGLAWTEADDDARLPLLDRIIARDGTWVEPTMTEPIAGPVAIADHIGAFHEGRPGEYFEWREDDLPDAHHDRISMPWRLCGPDGATLLEGTDFGVIGADGLFVEITTFHPPE